MKRYLNIKQVTEKVCFCRAQVYKMINENNFPPPHKIGVASRWDEEEIELWMNNNAPSHSAA